MIDTNVLIYDTYEDSMHHGDASQLLDRLEEWVIPLIVIYEYIWFLKGMGVDPSTALDKLEDYISSEKSRTYKEGELLIRKALGSLAEERISLNRFNDEVIIRIAREEGISLATFDKRMRSRARKLGVDVVPTR
ncbi:MAG: PIN domain-containing protein [Candidatus Korarchaeota archaeon]|nr:PIN domain-containing protein [Candidatus Korarchaeota archaeon]